MQTMIRNMQTIPVGFLQIGVLKEPDDVGFGGLLQRQQSLRLKAVLQLTSSDSIEHLLSNMMNVLDIVKSNNSREPPF